MKNVPAFLALLLICGAGTLKAQNSVTNLKPVNKNLLALNFIENVSFTPESTVKTGISSDENITRAENTNTNRLQSVTTSTSEAVTPDGIEKLLPTQFKYAMMMDVDVEALTNSSLYSFIDNWYGTHYRMGGTTKKGIDCSAFTGLLLATVYSFALPRTASEQYKMCEHIDKENLLAGDLVFFNTRGGVSHVGVYLADGHFVHSSSSDGVKISTLDDPYYSRKFIGGGRVNQ